MTRGTPSTTSDSGGKHHVGTTTHTETRNARGPEAQLWIDDHRHAHATGSVQQGSVQTHWQQRVPTKVANHLHAPQSIIRRAQSNSAFKPSQPLSCT